MKTSLSKAEISSRATAQLGTAHYNIFTQTETSMVFNGGKAINWVVFVLLVCVVLVGAVVYYVIAKEHQIVINIMPVDGRFEVTATGNSPKAQQIANTFTASLPPAS